MILHMLFHSDFDGVVIKDLWNKADTASGRGANSTITWVVGDTFLKNVYSVYRYDPPAVGFATLT